MILIVSLLTLKDEALDLWTGEWGSIYEEGSESRKLLQQVKDTWFLVSVVENDYINGDLFAAFDIQAPANGSSAPVTNGTANGAASKLEKAMPSHVGGADASKRTVSAIN